MRAENWEFKIYLPDDEDIEAKLIAAGAYFSLSGIPGRNDAEEVGDAFDAGFNRGIAWAIAKQSKDKYAKVKDNFVDNDRGKERFIGRIGKVLQIESDHYCFSQVLLGFENKETEWFSNTTLIEVDENGEIVKE